jgi:transposase
VSIRVLRPSVHPSFWSSSRECRDIGLCFRVALGIAHQHTDPPHSLGLLRARCEHATFAHDHEYKRHGTVSLLAGIDLLTGKVHALVKDRHRSREFIEFLKLVDTAYPADTAIHLILDNHSAHISRETRAWLAEQPAGRFEFTFTPKHGSWLNLVEGFFSKLARSVLRHIRVPSKQELKERLMAAVDYFNCDPVVHTWTYKIAGGTHRGTATPRWDWSGVDEVRVPEVCGESLKKIYEMLPVRRSSPQQLASEISALGARYHRYLHQDEFGPTRAECMAALRVMTASCAGTDLWVCGAGPISVFSGIMQLVHSAWRDS